MDAPIKIKRTAITLAQKVQIILKLNDPSFKQKEIAQEYGLTASAISKIVKKKEGILEEWLRGGNLERKRKREGKNQTVDDALLSWFWMASKEEGTISGPVLMAKAKALADDMGIEFKPTNGWLCRWKNRNNLAYRRLPREKAEILTASSQTPGLPMLVTPSLYLQDGQHIPEDYGEGTPTQRPEEAEEGSRDQTVEGMEQEEQDAHFYTVPSDKHSQWQAPAAVTSDSSSEEMASARLTGQQDAAMQHKPKRFKQEGVEPQPGHSCQSYTAPLDLRSQQEMPGTSHEAAATGCQSKAERVKTEEASRNYTYQFYNVSCEQQERRCISDLSDSSSDEVSLHRAASTHHPALAVKQEASSQKTFYAGWEKLPDQRHKPWLQDNPSDEIMKTKTPIYRSTVARSRLERIVQEEPLAEGHQSQGTPYTGKQTLTQVLQQLGTQRHLRGLYNEFPGSMELPEELSQDRYRALRKEDSTFKRRNQFCKGESSYKRALPLAAKVPAGCMKKSELATTYLLRNVYFAAKEMIPNSSTEALKELCLSQGLDDMVDVSIHQGGRSIEELQQAIAQVVDEGILSRARSCNCFSVLVDQSEDCLAEPCLFLYIRITEQVVGGYESKTYLLAVKEVGEEVTAERITAALWEVLEEKDLDVKLLCGLAIDGTAVSAECRSSVVAELRVRSPGLLSVCCLAHRLALSCVSAADTVPYLVKYQHLLDSLYTLLARSTRGWHGLEAVRKVLGGRDGQSSPFRDIFPSRWLTVGDSVEAIIRNFGKLIPLLRDGRSARGAGLAKAMCTYRFLHCSHFLADVLHQLSILGRSYQRQDVDFSIVHPLLKSTVTTINKLGAEGAGEMLKHLVAGLPAGTCQADGSFTFQGQPIRSEPHQRAEAETACAAFLCSLSRDLTARFTEPRDADTITALTAVLDPTHASDSKGRHLQMLTDYLSSLGGQGDTERFKMSCKQELISFMNFVESRPGLHTLASTKDVCRLALQQRLMFPVVGSLAERFLTLPIATAGLHTTFHRQHMLSNRLGHSLSTSSLENLLKIAMHGPPITQFNFASACHQLAVHQS